MSVEFPISIIIPTWNRKELLIESIESYLLQLKNYNKFEILIIDSNSTDGTEASIEKLKLKYKNLDIKILHSKFNNIALKRNLGMLNSSYDNLILTDDDCIPLDDFIETYKYFLEKKDKRLIYCGQYRTENVLKSNYARYRNSRNIIYNSNDKNYLLELSFNNIITGNMAFHKNFIIKDKILFNDSMTGYGFEDIEWAHRLKKAKYKLFLTQANVNHKETSYGISKYKLKWFYVGKYAMPLLKKYNIEAAKNLSVFKLEVGLNSILKRSFSFLIYDVILSETLISFVEYFLVKTDKLKLFYLPILYRVVLVKHYYNGIKSRQKVEMKQEDTYKDWYSKGYK